METSLNRNEKLIALFALGALGVFFVVFLHISNRATSSVSQIDPRSQINYQMARPDENFSEYSLSGREVDQVYEAVKAKEKAKALTQSPSKLKTEAEKKAELAKKMDAAKKAAAQTQAQARVSHATEQAKKSAISQPDLKKDAEIVVKSNQNNKTENSPQTNQATKNANEQVPKQASAPQAKVKKTFAEWRLLIFAQPTRESMNSILEAFHKNEITQTELQSLSQDLLDQTDEKLKGLGLYALRATPSLGSLSQLVHVESEVNASFKTYIDQAYLTYLQPQNVGFLNQALQTKDKALVLKSLNLLGVNLQKLAKGDYTSLVDPRNRRDADPNTGFTMNSYKSLIPVLTTLGTSQDQELAPLAQQIVSFIQSTNNVASN